MVFECAGCGAALTVPVTRVALPEHAHRAYGNGVALPPLVEAGTYAVDPAPSGAPWRPWSGLEPGEAAARGVFAPVHALSTGAPGAIVVAPGDTRGTVLIPTRLDGRCCGLDGRTGPNLACADCGRVVATRIDDCSLWQATWLVPGAVRRTPTGTPAGPTPDWATVTRPVEPFEEDTARLEVEAGVALAHLLAASAGMPVTVPDGVVANSFGTVLEVLPPAGPAKVATLAGPGLPAQDTADIVLVPRHPRTGRPWRPPGAATAVPVAAGLWTTLAFHPGPLIPATGGLPREFLRDDPPPTREWRWVRPYPDALLHTLARLPAVREPWLRAVYDDLWNSRYPSLI